MIAEWPDNKSLHPIWSIGPAFASCSIGAANAGPLAQTGELNRYPHPIAFITIPLYGFRDRTVRFPSDRQSSLDRTCNIFTEQR